MGRIKSEELADQHQRVTEQLIRQIRMALRRSSFDRDDYREVIEVRVRDQLSAWFDELELDVGLDVKVEDVEGGKPGEVDISWCLSGSWRDKIRLHALMCARLLDEPSAVSEREIEALLAEG